MNARQKKQYSEAPEVLKKSILTLRKKILDNESDYLAAPLTIEVKMADGRWVERVNPLAQEYRAMIRDFSAALKAYKDIVGNQDEPEISSLDGIRSRFKVAK